MTSIPQTLDQLEAKYALRCIKQAKGSSYSADYHRTVKRLPAMIITSGLGQSLAFLIGRSGGGTDGQKGALRAVYDDISGWLREMKVYAGAGDLLDQLTSSSMDSYMMGQEFTMRLLTWMVRFVDAFLPKEES